MRPVLPLVSLERRSFFSAGLRLCNPAFDEIWNRRVYGRETAPHGHEYVVSVAWNGPVSCEDGMIVNLIKIKPILQAAIQPLQGRFLNEDVAVFGQRAPTIEHIARLLWNALPQHIGAGQLCRLTLEQSRRSRVEIRPDSMKVSRSYEFAAAHRLSVPTLSDEENWQRFDKCSNRAGHGHNFQLEVWVEGAPDEDTGFIINPARLDAIVDEEVYQRFDHKHLNDDCPEFIEASLVPTSENLAIVIFNLLQNRLANAGYVLARVGLRETQKNYFEVEAQ